MKPKHYLFVILILVLLNSAQSAQFAFAHPSVADEFSLRIVVANVTRLLIALCALRLLLWNWHR